MTRHEKQILADEAMQTDTLTAFRLGKIIVMDDLIELLKDITETDDLEFTLMLLIALYEKAEAELVEKVLARYS